MIKIVSLIVLLAVIVVVFAHNNGVALTPPMGFNTWNQFACNINEDLVRETVDSIVSTGLVGVGYKYVNIDDCWSLKSGRNSSTGELIPDPVRFPHGIKALADYAHSKGVKLGIYSDVGFKTCAGYPGSFGYFEKDATTFANWGIDYLKLDFCNINSTIEQNPWIYYGQMSVALNKTGRPIVYSICNWGVHEPWLWAPQISNSWRTTGDIDATWKRTLEILDANRDLYKYSKVGAWNDPDMLEVGVVSGDKQLSQVQAKTHFTFWTALNSPLLLGNDLRQLSKPESQWIKNIIMNKDAISVNQDKAGVQAHLITENKKGVNPKGGCETNACIRTETWGRTLSGPANYAVILFNRAGLDVGDSKFNKEKITLNWSQLGLSDNVKLKIKDIWRGVEKGIFQGQYISDDIAQHDVEYLLLTKV
jgi:alpha-galactosidase